MEVSRRRAAATSQPYHSGMAYIPDDISQIPDNRPGYTPASDSERERLTILLHKRLDQIIDQEQQAGLSRQDRKRACTSRSEPTLQRSDMGHPRRQSGRSSADTGRVVNLVFLILGHTWVTRIGIEGVSQI